MRIDVWSDVICPWCYIGKRRFEAALGRFEHADEVEVVWRAFELDPTAPRVRDAGSVVERLATKYRVSQAQAQMMVDRVSAAAAGEGLEFHFERARAGNTFDAHRLLHHAHACGKQAELKERLLRAHFSEGETIGDPATLVRLAAEVGIEDAELVLASQQYAEDVRDDEVLARQLGITGVPFFVLDGRLGVSGAQPAEVLLAALQRAWAERPASDPDEHADAMVDGAACGPDGC